MRFQTRIVLVFSALIIVLFAGTGAVLYKAGSDTVRNDFGYQLEGIAATAALHIDGDAVAAVAKSGDMKSAAYKRLKRQLKAIRVANQRLKVYDLVLFRRTDAPNKWLYILDGDESEDMAKIADPFDATHWPEMRAAYNDSTHDRGYRSDEWGSYLSGYAPVRDASGETVAVLEAYANLDVVKRIEGYMVRSVFLALLIALALGLPCAVLLARHLAGPIEQLTAAARSVGSGNLDQRIELSGSKELQRLGRAFNEMVQGLKERDFVKDAFEKYVSKDVAHKIMALPLDQVLAGERRRVSVVFTDVRRFTEMSEKMRPEEILAVLNDHFSMLIDVLFEFEGTLDKFLGDGLMAIFGAPFSHGDDAERAVRAALRMQERIAEHNARQRASGRAPLEIGIGVNTGAAVAGNIGSSKRKEYSVIGDSVNVAARLQAIAPAGQVLISASTYEELRDLLEVEKLPPQALKGKAGLVEVYRAVRFLTLATEAA